MMPCDSVSLIVMLVAMRCVDSYTHGFVTDSYTHALLRSKETYRIVWCGLQAQRSNGSKSAGPS